MLETTKNKHFQALIGARMMIGHGGSHPESYVKAICEDAYGAVIHRSNWERWKLRALVFLDRDSDHGLLSEASYMSLWTLATLLKGNTKARPCNQVSRLKLAQAMVHIINGAPSEMPEPPENISYVDLKCLVCQQSLREYSDRYHRSNGLKKSKLFYSRCEALQILSRYPNPRIKNVNFKQAC